MSSRFTYPLHTGDVTRLEQGRPIRVITEPFQYHIGKKGSSDRVTIPKGFCSDGASVPRLLRGILEPWGKYAQAAIVHDFLYNTWQKPRKEADLIFREAILVISEDVGKDSGDPDYTWKGKFVAFITYWGVRIGGRGGYAKGRSNYQERANRAYEKVLGRDDKLTNLIIRSPSQLLKRSIDTHLDLFCS